MTKKDFLEKVEFFLKKNKMTPTAFGIASANNPGFVFDIRSGRECREATQKRVLGFMEEYEKVQKGAEDRNSWISFNQPPPGFPVGFFINKKERKQKNEQTNSAQN